MKYFKSFCMFAAFSFCSGMMNAENAPFNYLSLVNIKTVKSFFGGTTNYLCVGDEMLLDLSSDVAKRIQIRAELGEKGMAELFKGSIDSRGTIWLDQEKQDKMLLKAYYLAHPAGYTLTQKLLAGTLFTVVVGGFVAYNYFYASRHAGNAEEILDEDAC